MIQYSIDYHKSFRLLVHSLCPSIYGHELVKAALLMALFGGLLRDEEGVNKRIPFSN